MGADIKHRAIVIGASAGGLSVLSVILSGLPVNYPVPVIIVQHRIKDQRDLLEEVLQSKCRIKIKQADEKEKINGATIYVAPPDYHLLVEKDFRFSLSSDAPVHYSRPSIDVLFETAANAYGKGLTGIILTGANSDGALGLVAIKNAGGTTIVQDPKEAQFSFMPAAAIDAKGAKHVWTLKQIQNFFTENDTI